LHGGKSPQARAAAERRRAEAEAEAAKLLDSVVRDVDAEPVGDVVEALLKLAGQVTHALNELGRRLDREGLGGDVVPLAWRAALREARQLLIGIQRLDLEARQVELHQGQGQIVVQAYVRSPEAVPTMLPVEKDAMLRAFLAGIGRPSAGRARGGAA
jgi:hypothetical protein